MILDRTEAAYWLALSFALERERRRDRNGLVLTAHRRLGLGLLDLVRLDTRSLPALLEPYRGTLERLHAAEASVSGLAFLVDELAERGVEVVPVTSPMYPAHMVRALKPDTVPTVLSVVGDVRLLERPGVCVSGSRKAGATGNAFAVGCGLALAEAGITVITGLATGPDREALSGALRAEGRAVGVAAEGILLCRAVRDPAVAEGRLAVISEFHPKQRWQAGLAMARNRTLAGLSRALIVADCVQEGGTTNQVKVHTQVGMPVYVRRGPGEGAYVPSLAAWPGVSSLEWTSGPVVLPDGTSAAVSRVTPESAPDRPSPSAIAGPDRGDGDDLVARRREELEALDRLIAARKTELAALDAALRAHPVGRAAETAGPEPDTSLLLMVRESESTQYDSEVEQESSSELRILTVLGGVPDGLTAADLAKETGLQEAKARKVAKELVRAKQVEEVKVGRSTRFVIPRTLALFAGDRETP